jgi:hypothetical protein
MARVLHQVKVPSGSLKSHFSNSLIPPTMLYSTHPMLREVSAFSTLVSFNGFSCSTWSPVELDSMLKQTEMEEERLLAFRLPLTPVHQDDILQRYEEPETDDDDEDVVSDPEEEEEVSMIPEPDEETEGSVGVTEAVNAKEGNNHRSSTDSGTPPPPLISMQSTPPDIEM